MAEEKELPEDIEEAISIDPLGMASEMAQIIYTLSDAEIINVGAKQEAMEDCLNVIYKCNVIIKAQLEEQYSYYFKPKKNAKADTKKRSENEPKPTGEVAE